SFPNLCVKVVLVFDDPVGPPTLRLALRSNQQQPTTRQSHCRNLIGKLHWRLPNIRATIDPNPVISRATPQRSKNLWLLSFKPKPGESRSVQPEGKFQATTGAT